MAPKVRNSNDDSKDSTLSERSWYFLLKVMKDLYEKDSKTYPFIWNDAYHHEDFKKTVSKVRNIFGLRLNAATLLLKSSPIACMKECMNTLKSIEACPIFYIGQIFKDRLAVSVNGGACSFEVINSLLVRDTAQEWQDNQMRRGIGIRNAASFIQWPCRERILCVFLCLAAFSGMFCASFSETENITTAIVKNKLLKISSMTPTDLKEKLIQQESQMRGNPKLKPQILILISKGWNCSVNPFVTGIITEAENFKKEYYNTHNKKRIKGLTQSDLLDWNSFQNKMPSWIRNIVLEIWCWAISEDEDCTGVTDANDAFIQTIKPIMELLLSYICISESNFSTAEELNDQLTNYEKSVLQEAFDDRVTNRKRKTNKKRKRVSSKTVQISDDRQETGNEHGPTSNASKRVRTETSTEDNFVPIPMGHHLEPNDAFTSVNDLQPNSNLDLEGLSPLPAPEPLSQDHPTYLVPQPSLPSILGPASSQEIAAGSHAEPTPLPESSVADLATRKTLPAQPNPISEGTKYPHSKSTTLPTQPNLFQQGGISSNAISSSAPTMQPSNTSSTVRPSLPPTTLPSRKIEGPTTRLASRRRNTPPTHPPTSPPTRPPTTPPPRPPTTPPPRPPPSLLTRPPHDSLSVVNSSQDKRSSEVQDDIDELHNLLDLASEDVRPDETTSVTSYWKIFCSLNLQSMFVSSYNYEWVTEFNKRLDSIKHFPTILSSLQYASRWFHYIVLETRATLKDDIDSHFEGITNKTGYGTRTRSAKKNVLSQYEPLRAFVHKSSTSPQYLTSLECGFTDATRFSQKTHDLLSSQPYFIFRFVIFNRKYPSTFEDWNVSAILKLRSHLIEKYTASGQSSLPQDQICYDFSKVTFEFPVGRQYINELTRNGHNLKELEIEFHPISSSANATKMVSSLNQVSRFSDPWKFTVFGNGKNTASKRTINDSDIDQKSAYFLSRMKSIGKLNDTQHEAIKSALFAVENDLRIPFCCIQGPPGTGKTETILGIITSLLFHSKHGNDYLRTEYNPDSYQGALLSRKGNEEFAILVCTASNNALSNVQQKLLDGLPVYGKHDLNINLTRVYAQSFSKKQSNSHSSVNQDNTALSNQLRLYEDSGKSKKELKKSIFDESEVVLSTLSTACGMDISEISYFDIIIVDEATQATEPEILSCLSSVSNKTLRNPVVILVGDEKQLSPHMSSSNDYTPQDLRLLQYEISLFERLVTERRCNSTMLNVQYRAHPTISYFHSAEFYDSKVVDGKTADYFKSKYKYLYDNSTFWNPLTFVDTVKESRKRESSNHTNLLEVNVVLDILKFFNDRFRKLRRVRFKPSFGVLTPYRNQANRIQLDLDRTPFPNISVDVGTVDSMQGQQRDVIIFSAVRSNRDSILGFINDKRRINVSLSRSKAMLLFIGDSETLCRDNVFNHLYLDCSSRASHLEVQWDPHANRFRYWDYR